MRPLGRWPFVFVLLASLSWVLLCLLVPIAWATVDIWMQMRAARGSGSGGIGDVYFTLDALAVFLPPILFMMIWLFERVRARRYQ